MQKLLCVLLVVGGCASASGQEVRSERDSPAPGASTLAARVQTVRLVASEAPVVGSIPAELRASRDARLGAALGGFVESVRVEVGDVVRRGQVLATIDARLHAASREQAESQLERASNELRRAEQLVGAIPEAEIERARSAVRLARAGVDAAVASGRRATIRAPFDGTVSAVSIEPGEIVAPGGPVIRLLKLDRVRVVAGVSEQELAGIERGMKVEVHTLGATYEATIERIEPAADPRTHAFVVEASLDNAEGALLPGMLAKLAPARVPEGAGLAVPQSAILGHGAALSVFVVEAGRARSRGITLGPLTEGFALVARGLRPGEEIIALGHQQLMDGDAVEVVATEACCRVEQARFAVQP